MFNGVRFSTYHRVHDVIVIAQPGGLISTQHKGACARELSAYESDTASLGMQ